MSSLCMFGKSLSSSRENNFDFIFTQMSKIYISKMKANVY